MFKYKTLMYITIAAIVSTVLTFMLKRPPGYYVYKPAQFLSIIFHLTYLYTIIVVLKKQSENFWRTIPYYIMIAFSIIDCFTVIYLMPNLLQHNMMSYFYKLTLGYYMVMLYCLINTFLIKNAFVATYLKIQVAVIILLMVVQYALPRFLSQAVYMVFINYSGLMFLLPVLVILVLHYNLYQQYEAFRVGQHIITKREIENIPQGTIGIILKRHSNSTYYDVEFVDDRGNLLNELSLSSSDFEHAAGYDLETKVENFGRA